MLVTPNKEESEIALRSSGICCLCLPLEIGISLLVILESLVAFGSSIVAILLMTREGTQMTSDVVWHVLWKSCAIVSLLSFMVGALGLSSKRSFLKLFDASAIVVTIITILINAYTIYGCINGVSYTLSGRMTHIVIPATYSLFRMYCNVMIHTFATQ
eukprot:786178_1